VQLKDIVDGFVLSASQIYQMDNYRAHVLAQMEILRRATAYRCREYVVPKNGQTVPAYSQVEQSISVQPGSYLWGLTWTSPFNVTDDGTDGLYLYIQITDACTETPFFSDYVLAENFQATAASTANQVVRNPPLLSQPRLIGEPGKIDVELYNSYSSAMNCQLVLLVAEPTIAPDQMQRYYEQQRIRNLL
jgi:hypothetical protein